MSGKRRHAVYEFFRLPAVGDLDVRLATLVRNSEEEVLDVGLDFSITELATDEALRVEDGVVRVHGDLILGGITDQTPVVGEGHTRGWFGYPGRWR